MRKKHRLSIEAILSIKKLALVAVVATSALLGACGDRDPALQLQLSGSSTIAPLVVELAALFEREHPDVRIDVQTGGSSRGVLDTRAGLVNIGMVSRALKPQEKDLQAHTIARDGIAVIVHRDNPVDDLTRDQVAAIYRGQITNWRSLGGVERDISVVSKAEGRSTLELFLDYLDLNSSDIRAHTIIGDNEQGIKTVAANPGAIGYVSIGSAEYSAANKVAIKLLATDGVVASSANIGGGDFPLLRSLNLVTLAAPEGLAADFIAFAQSEKAHSLIRKQYFVPVDG